MKRVGYITDKDGRRITLLEAMGDYGNVQKAYNKARKCKRHRKDVLIFTKDKEENLDKVREDIINLAYEPSLQMQHTCLLGKMEYVQLTMQMNLHIMNLGLL